MATELVDLTVTEISLVDVPANKSARIVLFKRDAPPPTLVEKESDPMSEIVQSIHVLEKALTRGTTVEITKAEAEAALDIVARSIQDNALARGVAKSAEQAFVDAMDRVPTLAAIAVGEATA